MFIMIDKKGTALFIHIRNASYYILIVINIYMINDIVIIYKYLICKYNNNITI